MRKFLTFLLGLIALVVVGLVIAPGFLPMDLYRGQIARLAEQATGRTVRIDGDVRLSLLPRFEINVHDVTIGNAPGGKAPYFAKMDELGLGLDLMALLERTLSVNRLDLVAPVINLEEGAKGHGNWEFTPHTEEQKPESGADALPFTLSDIRFDNVRLSNGTVRYRSAEGDVSTYTGLNGTLVLHGLDSPLQINGSFALGEQPVDIDAKLDLPRALLEGGESPVRMVLSSALFTGDFTGKTVRVTGKPVTTIGDLTLDIPSVRRLAAALGSPIEGQAGFGRLTISGKAEANSIRIAFRQARLTFDGMKGRGDLLLRLQGARPKLLATLSVDTFNANSFMTEPTKAAAAPGQAAPSRQNQTQNQAKSTGWSTTPLDFSALGSLDADLTLSAGGIRFQDLRVGKSNLALTLVNGLLTAKLTDMSLYEGSGTGTLTINARKPAARIASTFTLTDIDTYAFLKDAMGFDRIEGVGTIRYDLTARGKSQRDFIRTLTGTAALDVRDGAWRGVNLAELARTASAFLGKNKTASETDNAPAPQDGEAANTPSQPEEPDATDASKKTDFAEMTATFTLRNGVITNDDLTLLNPFLRMTGKGQIHLVKRVINYRIQSKLVGSIKGQGGQADLSGLVIPIKVDGPLDQPRYQLDVARLLAGNLVPGAETENPVESLLGGVLNRALGKDDDQQDGQTNGTATDQQTASPDQSQNQTEPAAPTPQDLLRNLFDALANPDDGDEADPPPNP